MACTIILGVIFTLLSLGLHVTRLPSTTGESGHRGGVGLLAGRSVGEVRSMTSERDSVATSGQEWVAIASFKNRHAAERALASLGHEFRRNARKGRTDAFVVSGNADGSLKLTESRLLQASGLAATITRVFASMLAGLVGVGAMLKGAKGTAHAVHKRASHVGSEAQRLHEILAQAGPDAAILLVRCQDAETGQLVAAAAADQASHSWDGSMPDFLAGLKPGSEHDWVRAALDKPSSAKG